MLGGKIIPGHQNGVEVETLKTSLVHRRHVPAVSGNPDKTDEPLFPGLNRSLQGTSRRKSLLPFVGMDQRMKLDQVQLVRTEPVEGPADLFSCFLVGTFSGFGGKKKILPVFFHPWTDSQFRISIIRCRINVIDAEFEQ